MSRSLKHIAILGTGSDVGKSLIVAALCRLMSHRGVRVAPFKAQNMSLNSFVTVDGGEMGRAQVLQAQACGVTPHTDMNPILLKPEADSRSQVIVHGRVWRSQEADEYFHKTGDLFKYVQESFERLTMHYDMLVIEGAGSAAELNLRDRDIVNWRVVDMANANVILVADIDRGGVFAQVIGTIDLLEPKERGRIVGIVINKFRGDAALFADGVKLIEERTGIPVLGVIPFLRNLELDQEDSVELDRTHSEPFAPEKINIAVVLLPHMSNFTDFNALGAEPDVVLKYVSKSQELEGADVVVLPGSKTTIADLEYLRKQGFEQPLQSLRKHGVEIVGVCGGFQMMGTEISDPSHIETGGEVRGLGWLEMSTVLAEVKRTVQVTAFPKFLAEDTGCQVMGYEIHMGQTERMPSTLPSFQISSTESFSAPDNPLEGGMSPDGMVWGSYIHGLFDQPGFRRAWLNRVRDRKGLTPLERKVSEEVTRRLDQALDRWVDHVQKHVNVWHGENFFNSLFR